MLADRVALEASRQHGVFDVRGRVHLDGSCLEIGGASAARRSACSVGHWDDPSFSSAAKTTRSAFLMWIKTGCSAALRHLLRMGRIALPVARETVECPDCQLVYQESALHKGDVFTKKLGPATYV